jgi:hypothetical protein
MYNLPGGDDPHEWIELYNLGYSVIDLNGWKFNDGSNHLLKEYNGRGLIIPGKGYAVLADDAYTFIMDHGGTSSYTGVVIDTVMALSNTSDTIKMITPDGDPIGTVTYYDSWGADENGKTLAKIDPAGGNSSINWTEGVVDGGTPGKYNEILPSIIAITPNSGINTGTISVIIAGSKFQPRATVTLTKTNEPNITGTDTVIVSPSTITATFNLTGAQPGVWDVVVTQGNQSGTLTKGFKVLIDNDLGETQTKAISHGTVTVVFAPNTFEEDYYAEIEDASGVITLPPNNIGIGIRISVYNSYGAALTTLFNPARVEIPYANTGSINENSLRLYNSSDGINWTLIEDSGVYPDRNVVWGTITYLSYFAPAGISDQVPDQVIVYPNPYKAWEHGQITFWGKKLTQGTVIKIYNVAGELIKSLKEFGNDYQVTWQADNDSGRPVASGIYIYIITNPAGEKRVGKIGIIK